MEATATPLHLKKNTSLLYNVESRYSPVGELNDGVAVFEEDGVVLKNALRHIHRETRD